MVGNHFQARLVHAECHTGFARSGFEQVLEKVDFIVGVHMLHHGGHALQAHAGIHAGLGQQIHHVVAVLVAVVAFVDGGEDGFVGGAGRVLLEAAAGADFGGSVDPKLQIGVRADDGAVVAAVEDGGQALRLDGGRLRVAERVDALLQAALKPTDQAERTKDYQQAQKIVIDEAAYVYLFQKNYQLAMNKEVKGFTFNPMLEQVFNIATMSK